MKARIKSNGKIVEVISRFMPRKRNVASRDWVCNLSDGTCIDESQLEYIEESIDGLDEAAKEYEKQVIEETKCHHNALTYAEGYEDALLLIPDAFIAGAKWQAAHTPLPEDTVLFQKGVEEGKRLMMEEAVEGEVVKTFPEDGFVSVHYPIPPIGRMAYFCKYNGQNIGDKVRIIIIKED